MGRSKTPKMIRKHHAAVCEWLSSLDGNPEKHWSYDRQIEYFDKLLETHILTYFTNQQGSDEKPRDARSARNYFDNLVRANPSDGKDGFPSARNIDEAFQLGSGAFAPKYLEKVGYKPGQVQVADEPPVPVAATDDVDSSPDAHTDPGSDADVDFEADADSDPSDEVDVKSDADVEYEPRNKQRADTLPDRSHQRGVARTKKVQDMRERPTITKLTVRSKRGKPEDESSVEWKPSSETPREQTVVRESRPVPVIRHKSSEPYQPEPQEQGVSRTVKCAVIVDATNSAAKKQSVTALVEEDKRSATRKRSVPQRDMDDVTGAVSMKPPSKEQEEVVATEGDRSSSAQPAQRETANATDAVCSKPPSMEQEEAVAAAGDGRSNLGQPVGRKKSSLAPETNDAIATESLEPSAKKASVAVSAESGNSSNSQHPVAQKRTSLMREQVELDNTADANSAEPPRKKLKLLPTPATANDNTQRAKPTENDNAPQPLGSDVKKSSLSKPNFQHTPTAQTRLTGR